jgi:hypothetical protein
MRLIPLLFLLALCLLIGVSSAAFTLTFDVDDEVHANQSIAQDPTHGSSTPWELYVLSGLIGLVLIVLSLCRSKSQRMDYEINIILSVLAWPFVWYWTWAGLTSVDRIVGFAGASMSDVASSSNEAAYVTQHILYSFWVLGWIGVAGGIFAVFVTALLVSQYNLFRDNEATAEAERQKQSDL